MNVLRLKCKVSVFQVIIFAELSLEIFENYLKKFHKIISIGRRVVSDGRTAVQTDLTKVLVRFYNFFRFNEPRIF